MVKIKAWREPPPGPKKSDPYALAYRAVNQDPYSELAAELRTRPGEWAELDTEGVSAANAVEIIKVGRYRSLCPAGSFHAVLRTEGHTSVAYAIYLGEPPNG